MRPTSRIAPLALLCAILLTYSVAPSTSSLAAYSETRSFRDALDGRSMEDAISGPVDKDTSSYGDRAAPTGASGATSGAASAGQSSMLSIPANGNLQQQQQTSDEPQQKTSGPESDSELEREAGPIGKGLGLPTDTQQMLEQRARQVQRAGSMRSPSARLMAAGMQMNARLQQQPESSYSNPATKSKASDAGFDEPATKQAGAGKPANGYGRSTPGESKSTGGNEANQNGGAGYDRSNGNGADEQQQSGGAGDQQQQVMNGSSDQPEQQQQQDRSEDSYSGSDAATQMAAKQKAAMAAMLMAMGNGAGYSAGNANGNGNGNGNGMKYARSMVPSSIGASGSQYGDKSAMPSMAQNMIMSLANKAAYANQQSQQQQQQQQQMSQRQVAPPMMMAANGYGRMSQQMDSPMYNSMLMSGAGAPNAMRRGGMRRASQRRGVERKMSPAMVNAMLNKMVTMSARQQQDGSDKSYGGSADKNAPAGGSYMKPANGNGNYNGNGNGNAYGNGINGAAAAAAALLMKPIKPARAEVLARMMLMQPAQAAGALAAMPPAKREQYKKMMIAAIMQQQQETGSGDQEQQSEYDGQEQQQQQQPEQDQQQQQQQQQQQPNAGEGAYGSKSAGTNSPKAGANGYEKMGAISPMSMVMNMLGNGKQNGANGYGGQQQSRGPQSMEGGAYGDRSMASKTNGRNGKGARGNANDYGGADSQQQEQQPEQQKMGPIMPTLSPYGAQDQQQRTMQIPMSPMMMMAVMANGNGDSGAMMSPMNGAGGRGYGAPANRMSYGAQPASSPTGLKGGARSGLGDNMPYGGQANDEQTTQSSYSNGGDMEQQREFASTMTPKPTGTKSGASDDSGAPYAANGAAMNPMNGFRQAYNPQQTAKGGERTGAGGQGPYESMAPQSESNGAPGAGTKSGAGGDYPTSTAVPRPMQPQQKQESYGSQQQEGDEQQPEQQQQDEYGAAPMGQAEPFAFDYKIADNYGNGQYRKEESDKNGVVRGSYGYMDMNGIYRHVEYVADENGFRANIKSNEPGLSNEPGAKSGSGSPDQSQMMDNGNAAGDSGNSQMEMSIDNLRANGATQQQLYPNQVQTNESGEK